MNKRLGILLIPVVAAGLVVGCGGGDEPMEPAPPAVTPPPDLSGTYTLVSLTGAITGGATFGPPNVMGTFTLSQGAPSGDTASGTLSLSISAPAFEFMLEDRGTFTIRADGSWEQRAETGQAVGTFTLAGNVLTVVVTEPATAASTTVWQRQ
ncbi:hypothetical protein [Candidatus Palauibacter sp.]|uniref:hypothetical protein n=1 Tax=Candidatus Palauibacter sp. TaxID=3101350 RepID=UPI003B5B75C9